MREYPANYEYHVGGSLPVDASSYVMRQADSDFYSLLKAGQFCYVLNSRQMGKSSLRVRTMQRLQAEGFLCAFIDLTGIGKEEVTAEKWYAGLVQSLVSSSQLGKKFKLRTWWKEQRELLSPVQRLSLFIEDVLLTEIKQNIVIFVDEIDRVLSQSFSVDDFFALIRFFYNRRVDEPKYQRLTFALLGVATPSDLIADKTQTPFNIGTAIALQGFQLHEVQPLTDGLTGKVSNPQDAIAQILDWTGGQPFLTQKLCKLMVEESALGNSPSVEQVVKSRILENWESQDEPEHLRTIRDRILRNEQKAGQLLGIYQEILQQTEVTADGSREQTELRLSGLVIQQQGKLRAYNRIYQQVFNKTWVEKQLEKLRPYSQIFKAWVASDFQDESRLLRGQALQDALSWSNKQSLSTLDYRFLAISQKSERELEKIEAKIKLEAEKKEKQILTEAYKEANLIKDKAQKKAQKIIQIGLFAVASMLVIAAITVAKANIRDINSQLRNQSAVSESLFKSNLELESLLASLATAKQLKQLKRWRIVERETHAQVVASLRQIVYGIREQNRFEFQGNPTQVWRVAFSSDSQILASGSDDKTVKLWSRDGTLLKTLSGHQGEIWSVSFSPDGQVIASGSSDGVIKLWSRNGKLLKTLIGYTDRVSSINFSPDGQMLAAASFDKTVKLWKRDGTLLKTLKGHQDKVICVIFSPDGQMLATGSDDKTVKLWKRDGTLVDSFSGHTDKVWRVTFSSNGQMLASGGADKMVKLWSTSGNLLATLPTDNGRVHQLKFSPDGQSIISGNESNTVNIWKLDGTPLETVTELGPIINTYINFSPDNKTIATSNYDGSIKLWQWESNPLKKFIAHKAAVWSVSFSPDGQNIVTGSWDGTVKLWQRDGTLIKTLSEHSWEPSVSFGPDGQAFATISRDKTVKLWKRDGTLLKTIKNDRAEGFFDPISFSPDGQTLVTVSSKTVKFWNRDGTLIKTLIGHSGAVLSVNFSPDGQVLASSSKDRTTKLWSRSGTLLTTLTRHRGAVSDVTFSPDGQTIATASWDKTIKLWRRDGTLITTLQGHSAVVHSVAFSPDSQIIASAGADKTVRLWRRDGTLLSTLIGHKNRVFGVSFSPDGKTLASASEDKTVILWNLDLDNLMVRGCRWLRDYLKTNPNLSESDRHICDGLEPSK